MKKIWKVTAIVLACLLALMVALPYAFRGKIKEVVVTEGNKMLNAKFDFESLDISLFKSFPKASVTLTNFWLKGVDQFENDTLLRAGELTAAVDIFSFFGDSGYDISKISLEDTYLHAIVLPDGKANWDIMKSDSSVVTSEETTESTPVKLQLQKLAFTNINLIYDDRKEKIYAEIKNIGAICSGDLGSDHTLLQLEAECKETSVKMDGIPFLSKAEIAVKMDVDADLVNSKFTLKDNSFRLNAIRAAVDGWLAMTPTGMEMDVKLNTNEVGFKELLSLIPAIYAKEFESLTTDGSVTLSAFAKGKMEGELLPAFELAMQVKNGMFKYPSLPAGVTQINMNALVKNPGGTVDQTVISITPFSFTLAGNPFSLTAQVKTPISDPDFQVAAKGVLNLGMIKQVYPLEGMDLKGIITADMQAAGRVSYLNSGKMDQVKASGTISLKDMTLKMKDMPDVDIRQSLFSFTPQYLNLSETTVTIGKNDITANCKLENYMAYALQGKTIKGKMTVQSNYFNLNDFMTNAPDSTATTVTSETAMSVIEIPRNIDFDMDANMKKVVFDKMEIGHVNGRLLVKEGTVDMKNLSMQAMGGNVVMSGSYSTAVSVEQPDLNASFSLKELSFAQTFKELELVQQMAPVFENLKGNYSGSMKIDTKLNKEMSPELNTLQGSGSLSTNDISLSGVKVIDQIAAAVKSPSLKELKVKNMNIDFTIKDGRIATKPFDIKLGETVLNLSGTTGLDQTIDYSGKVKLPASIGGIAKMGTLDLKIGGTFTSPKVSVDTKSMTNQAVEVIKDKAIEEIGKKLGIDVGDAEKQKEALLDAAKSTGEKLVSEAQKQADALVEKAGGNPLKKLAARKAGDLLVKEARKQADALVVKAQENAN